MFGSVYVMSCNDLTNRIESLMISLTTQHFFFFWKTQIRLYWLISTGTQIVIQICIGDAICIVSYINRFESIDFYFTHMSFDSVLLWSINCLEICVISLPDTIKLEEENNKLDRTLFATAHGFATVFRQREREILIQEIYWTHWTFHKF